MTMAPARWRTAAFIAASTALGPLGGCERSSELVDPDQVDCGSGEAAVELHTDDGLMLVADYRPAAEPERGAVVLFHMIPPQYDRSTWPPEVRQAFADLGLGVLAVDRRGAGESEGEPEDAYQGEGGRLDMEAAVSFLVSDQRACPADPDRVLLVGASNGTTAVMDYAVAHSADQPPPAGLVWMSPGDYTENQHRVDESRPVLEELPMLWLYPTDEPWSEGFVDGAPETWEFVPRGEEHGTFMFDGGDLEEATVADLVAFAGEVVGR